MSNETLSFTKLPRIYSVDERIRNSEKFFRIKDAEKAVATADEALRSRVEKKVERKKKEKKELEKYKLLHNGEEPPARPVEKSLSDSPPPESFFSSHVLNDDPSLSKYLLYDELVFPKPYQTVDLPPDFIDKMWVSGFLDRSNRDGPAVLKAAHKKQLQAVRKNIDAEVISIATESMVSSEKRNNRKAGIKTTASGKKKGASGGLPGGGGSLTSLSIDDSSTIGSDSLAHLGVGGPAHSLYGDISNLESDILSVELSMTSSQKQTKKHLEDEQDAVNNRVKARLEAVRKRAADIAAMPKKWKPYLDSIEKVVQRQRKIKTPDTKGFSNFTSIELDNIFDRERIEHEAARVIQKFWKKTQRTKPWNYMIKRMFAAQVIQRIVRGAITRKWVARWFNTRSAVITSIQANIRRVLSNNHLRPQQHKEQLAAITIQRIVRGKIGRLRWNRKHYHVACVHIQAVWRGVVARSRSDRLWLDKQVVPIQKAARKMVAVKFVKALRVELNDAALFIQKKFRCWRSLRKLSKKLIARESEYRMDNITLLTNEEEFYQEKIGKTLTRIFEKNLKGQAEAKLKAELDALQDVYELENDVIEINRQMEILSPRAIVQGYYQELNSNIIELRGKLTKMKQDTLFNKSLEMQRMDHLVEEKIKEVEDLASMRERLAKWRDLEYAERLERTAAKELLDRQIARKKAIAAERRKWTVRFTTKDGKPDKKRRPGKAWDPSVYAGPEKSTYTSGGKVNLFAEKPTGKPGTKESVEKTLNQMALQTYLEEVNAYQQILDPITQIMQKAMGAPKGGPAPEDLGWGEEGKKLAPVMYKIGAVPASWHRPLSPGGSTLLSDQEIHRQEEEKARITFEEEEKAAGRWREDHKIEDFQFQRKPKDNGALYSLADPRNKLRALEEAANVEKRKHVAEANRVRREKQREKKKKAGRAPAAIPWALLDALDAAKGSWENEKNYLSYAHRFEHDYKPRPRELKPLKKTAEELEIEKKQKEEAEAAAKALEDLDETAGYDFGD